MQWSKQNIPSESGLPLIVEGSRLTTVAGYSFSTCSMRMALSLDSSPMPRNPKDHFFLRSPAMQYESLIFRTQISTDLRKSLLQTLQIPTLIHRISMKNHTLNINL